MTKKLILVMLVCNSLVYAQWPQWRGPMRDGVSLETNLLKSWPAEGPKLLWSCDTIGDGYASAIIQDQIVYVTGGVEKVPMMTALDLSGNMIWECKIGESTEDSTENSTPTLYQDKLYTLTCPGALVCVDAKTGMVVWTVNIPEKFGVKSHYCESPLVVDDKVIVSPFGENTSIVALNRTTGETLWQFDSPDDGTSFVSPILMQGTHKKIIVTNGKKHVYALDLATGNMIWQGDISTTSHIPVPYQHQVYIPSCMMLKIEPDENRVDTLWQEPLELCNFGGAVKLGNRIFATYEKRSGLVCLDWDTGKQVALNRTIKSANLVVADGMLYSYEDKSGRVSLLKPMDDTIEVVSSFRIKEGVGRHLAHMAIGHGILFIRRGGILMAYDIKQS